MSGTRDAKPAPRPVRRAAQHARARHTRVRHHHPGARLGRRAAVPHPDGCPHPRALRANRPRACRRAQHRAARDRRRGPRPTRRHGGRSWPPDPPRARGIAPGASAAVGTSPSCPSAGTAWENLGNLAGAGEFMERIGCVGQHEPDRSGKQNCSAQTYGASHQARNTTVCRKDSRTPCPVVGIGWTFAIKWRREPGSLRARGRRLLFLRRIIRSGWYTSPGDAATVGAALTG